MDTKLLVMIEESQVLDTHLNLMTDLTGSFAKMFNKMSSGIWFFFWRIGGSLVWDIFSGGRGDRRKERAGIVLKKLTFIF